MAIGLGRLWHGVQCIVASCRLAMPPDSCTIRLREQPGLGKLPPQKWGVGLWGGCTTFARMIRVLLGEGHIALTGSKRLLLAETDHIRLEAHYPNTLRVRHFVACHQPHAVLLHIAMPVVNGPQGLRSMRKAGSAVPVLMFAGIADNERVFQA